MNFMEMRCCGSVWYWVLLLLLKLMPLKSHPSAASPVRALGRGRRRAGRAGAEAGQDSGGSRRRRAAAARRVKHCHVLFSPHTSA